jgi:hypothetical protein
MALWLDMVLLQLAFHAGLYMLAFSACGGIIRLPWLSGFSRFYGLLAYWLSSRFAGDLDAISVRGSLGNACL